MAGTHRGTSPASRRSTTRIVAALFAGSAVIFTVAVVQDGTLFAGGDGTVVGPPSNETAPGPSPETAATPQDSGLRPQRDDEQPVVALRSEGTATGPSPTGAWAREAPAVPGAAADEAVQWTPGVSPGWKTSLPAALTRQEPAQMEPAQMEPAPAAQHPPTADGAEQPDNGVVDDLLGSFGAGAEVRIRI